MNLFNQAYNNLLNNPGHVLLSDANHNYTLSDIDEISAKVYRSLMMRGIGRESIVMILLPRCAMTACIFLGVLRAGACSVIIDAGASAEYLSFFLNDANPTVVITDDERLLSVMHSIEQMPLILSISEVMAAEPMTGWENPSPHDAAFVVYTSSSSGRPKGAVHEYGDIDLELEYVFGRINGEYDFAHERVALVTEMYDIATITALIEAFYSASYLHVIDRNICRNSESYAGVIRERKLTTAALMPHMTDLGLLSEIPSIEYLFVGFDVIENVYIPELPIFNSYGMSESVITAASFLIDRNYDITPVGRPNDFRGTFLADENDKSVDVGEIGEVVFKNPFFRGYLNLPDTTAKALRNGLYHTGDMGVINPDGNLVILGRKSDIIKTEKGWLIPAVVKVELEKICKEKIAVRAFAKETGNRIVVFYTGPNRWVVDDVNAELKGHLPDYMLPTDYIHLEALPLLTSGKLNRVMLEKIFDEKSNKVCG